ncbi:MULTISPECIES: hypothetical protein [Clostridium]|uniref:Uncharacterized protein n=1 Tax=Clostridium novyi (strain NT) TaxID=386415 RepID=A0PY65_CLONN|nr:MULTISPECIES: hypothetical protein [Clostridium]ABK62060.1 hypothetical protein NT01CX_1234 [Clostridium novyi NT]KEH87877.1 hypothetical protein Z966_09770 [Clostridium novyi A str. NCTC 538]KEH90104.1 hypothetical protein Z967_00325 [Clostridium novyi A str. 4540]KEH91252.1 hypothetical protein Z965_03560 [Clostridium novyi A str. BKT29909]KEH94655.1 hypothetical protein Z963_08770 [Clostridium botulinum C/D str. It1]
MLKIIGRLIGLGKEEMKYNREILIFMLISAFIFFIIGVSHTNEGASFIYANRLKIFLEAKNEKAGVTKEDIDKIIYDYKEAVPVNVREFEINDIKDRVDNYIHQLKNYNNPSLNELIRSMEDAKDTDNKETLIKNLNSIDLREMLNIISKKYITSEKLQNVAKWQENTWLSIMYFSLATLNLFMVIVIKVICDIKLFKRSV